MAVSELQSRLEHLVTYSSQLIFISGDSVASQQRSLQAFVGQQSENTEIAFINAEADLSVEQYRQQIVRQLLGHDSTMVSRPLNELLSPLNQHDGPVLIFICEAQHIPQKFLQELWELVLQSRFAANKQHLNVLLFGETSWTEKAKAWLPANNRDKPLLLSTESISAETQLQESDLDRMIAQKRRQFEQRLRDRATGEVHPASNLSTWWFRLIIVFAFLSAFAGIMLWQYSDQFSEMLAANTQQISSQDTVTVAPELIEDPVTTDTDGLAAAAQSEPELITSMEPEDIKYEIVQLPSQNQQQSQGIDQQTETSTLSVADDQNTVVDWQTAVSQMSPANEESIESNVRVVAAPRVQEFNEAPTEEVLQPGDNKEALTEFPQNEQPLDYQVEDIVSVEQLPPNPEAASATEVTELPEQSTSLEVTTTVAEEDTQRPEAEISQTDLEQSGIPELSDLPLNEFVIQIAGLSSESVLKEYLEDNRLSDQVWLYTTQRYGGDWHVVIYQHSYPSIQQARDAMLALPSAMQTGTPFVKSVAQVQEEMENK